MFLVTLLLPLLASASVLQFPGLTGAGAVKVEKLEPKYRKTANRNRYLVGPYTLRASKGVSGFGDSTLSGQPIFYRMPKTLCNSAGPCTILAAQTGVVYADGKEANPSNGIYIHHILTSDSTKRQKAWLSNCGSPTRPATNIAGILGGTAFVGTGEDSADGGALYTSEDGTRNSGYHVGAGDAFTGWAQLVNYNKEAKQIYVFYDLEWIPGIVGDDVKTATFTSTCGGGMIRLSNNGPTNSTSGKFYFMEDGTILGARGHLHGTSNMFFVTTLSNEQQMVVSRSVCSSTISSSARPTPCTVRGLEGTLRWVVIAMEVQLQQPVAKQRVQLLKPFLQ